MDKEEKITEEVSVNRFPVRVAFMLTSLAVFLCNSALAADGETTTATGSLETVMNYMDDVTDLCNEVWNLLTSNGYFAIYLAFGLLAAGIGIFKRVKRAARR